MSSEPTLKVSGIDLGETLGRGGFGVVYRGHHQVLDINVAVKLLNTASSPVGALDADQTLREAQFMARLDHPNLLRIFDAGRLGAWIYFVLEFMDGGSCAKLRNLPADQALAVANQLLSGLQALHDAKVLHRDIKPANCLLRARDGRLKLADLGIAVELATHSEKIYDTAGTLPFMAPELFERPPQYSTSSDLYALGMTLACMFLNSDPFPSGSLGEIVMWAREGERPQLTALRSDLPPALPRLVEKLISPRKDDRPRSATEALASLGNNVTIPATVHKRPSYPSAKMVGPWILGDQVYESSNWHGYVVTHLETGAAARLMHLQPHGPLAKTTEAILLAAERASRLSHPCIVRVLDWGTQNDRAYVVTAQQGRTLGDLVSSGRPCPEIEALGFIISLADALAYLHANNLVYQNVDPGAAVIAPNARSAQLSWLAFCTPAGTPVITSDGKHRRFFVPAFSAPEVLAGISSTIEPSADLYGLGTVLYYLLVGDKVYKTNPKPQTLAQVRAAAPLISAPTGRLIIELLSPDPQQRPSAVTVRDEATQILRQLGR